MLAHHILCFVNACVIVCLTWHSDMTSMLACHINGYRKKLMGKNYNILNKI